MLQHGKRLRLLRIQRILCLIEPAANAGKRPLCRRCLSFIQSKQSAGIMLQCLLHRPVNMILPAGQKLRTMLCLIFPGKCFHCRLYHALWLCHCLPLKQLHTQLLQLSKEQLQLRSFLEYRCKCSSAPGQQQTEHAQPFIK